MLHSRKITPSESVAFCRFAVPTGEEKRSNHQLFNPYSSIVELVLAQPEVNAPSS
jgi:hypothetical protein